MKILGYTFFERSEAQQQALEQINQWQDPGLLPAQMPQGDWIDPSTGLNWQQPDSMIEDWITAQFHDGQSCIRADAPNFDIESPAYREWYENYTDTPLQPGEQLPMPAYQACYDQNGALTDSGTFDSASGNQDTLTHFVNDVYIHLESAADLSSSSDSGADFD